MPRLTNRTNSTKIGRRSTNKKPIILRSPTYLVNEMNFLTVVNLYRLLVARVPGFDQLNCSFLFSADLMASCTGLLGVWGGRCAGLEQQNRFYWIFTALLDMPDRPCLATEQRWPAYLFIKKICCGFVDEFAFPVLSLFLVLLTILQCLLYGSSQLGILHTSGWWWCGISVGLF